MNMNKMNIESAKYVLNLEGENACISATIDGVSRAVPLDPENTTYAEIMRQVDAGELTIEEAE
tara:strand:- start:6 stop:194 length:189 start_codon:yes stop_codon:yes gene_type:complete